MDSFAQDLSVARENRIPRMALRPDSQFPDELDDIVVEDVKMFRAEAMSNNEWWLCCYFANGERLTMWVRRATKPSRITVFDTERPAEWVDIDD